MLVQAKQEQPALASVDVQVSEQLATYDNVLVSCQPSRQAISSASAASSAEPPASWQQMLVAVSPKYPEHPPILSFSTDLDEVASAKVCLHLTHKAIAAMSVCI